MSATSDGTCNPAKPRFAKPAATKWGRRLGRAAWPGRWLTIALTVLLAGCVRVAQFPDPKPAPVFELQVIDSRPCPTAADPQLACFTVELRNRGERAGKGTCVVSADFHAANRTPMVAVGLRFSCCCIPLLATDPTPADLLAARGGR